jgi:hypothetical protein
MKKLILSALLLACPLFALAAIPVTTTKKTALTIGGGTIALAKGTKLEAVGREGDQLLVKFRAIQGKVPAADTDLPAEAAVPEAAAAQPAEAKPALAAAPATPPATVAAAKPAAPAVPPPALSTDGKPASTYGKAVQKAKQAEQAHKSSHVDPTKDILDEQPKK